MTVLIGNDRNQMQLMSLSMFISSDNPVRLIDAFVDKIELSKIGVKIPDAVEGRSAFPPSSLMKLYFYGYLNRVRSSRKLEKECERNIEVKWLMQELAPCYKTIADFRKNYPDVITNVFKLFVGFIKNAELIGANTVAIDGSKFRAVNSKKNNFNQKKIDRYQEYIQRQAEQYLKELDEADNEEDAQEKLLKINKIKEKLEFLKERQRKYDNLQQALDNSDEIQISTTDPDSRALIINRNTVEVAYNTQSTVDDKYNLVVDYQATNENDTKALFEMSKRAKEVVEKDTITVLADKGYHNGEQLAFCEDENITTIVACREQSTVKHLEKEFLVENFTYDKENDTYTCPNGEILRTNGNWYNKNHDSEKRKKTRKNTTNYRLKQYKTTACKSCHLKEQCTKIKTGRMIERSEHQDVVDRNNQRLHVQKELYRRRQAIVEHPFGTIKRAWGFSFTLLKGLRKVNGEMGLIFIAYNFIRVKNILGFDKFMLLLQNWEPDYSGFCFLLKKRLLKISLTLRQFFIPTYHLEILLLIYRI
jgi:transposase